MDFSSIVVQYSVPDIVAATTLGAASEWVLLSFPYATTRWQFEVDYPGSGIVPPAEQLTVGGSVAVAWNNYSSLVSCIPTATQPFGTGCNDATHSVYTMVLNAQTNAALGASAMQVMVQGLECPYSGCSTAPPAVINSTYLLWSAASTWAALNVSAPTAGSSVTIPPTAWVVFDLAGAPAYDLIDVQGRLTFADVQDLELIATRILVTGDFEIGSASTPYAHQATVTLTGSVTSPVLSVDNSQLDTLGNKVLAVFGTVAFYGQPIVNTWTTLSATVLPGAKTLTVVGAISDWAVGDTIALSSTEYDPRQREVLTITAISGKTITFTPALQYRHFAGAVDYSATASVTFAAKVGLLTRNIVIRGSMTAADLTTAWGAHVVVSEIPSTAAHATVVAGKLNLNYVQLSSVGQGYTTPALLLHYFYGADNTGAYKTTYYTANPVSAVASAITAGSINRLTGCSFSTLYGQGIVTDGAPNVVLAGNVMDTPYAYGLSMDAASVNSVLTNNLIINAQRSPLDLADHHHPISAIYTLAFPLVFTTNVVAGANDSAVTAFFPACSVTATWSLEVHSASTGVWSLPETTAACVQLSNVVAWKIGHIALYTVDNLASIAITNVVVADSHMGTSINNYAISSSTVFTVTVSNSIFFGTTPASTCAASLNCSGAATFNDVLGVSPVCGSAFGNAYRHVGITSNAYYGRSRTCLLFTAYGAAAECTPVNQFVFNCALPMESRYGLPDTVFGSQSITNVVFAYWSTNECGGYRSAAIAYEPYSDSFAPEIQVSGVTWYKSTAAAKISTALTAVSENCVAGCDGYDQFAIYDLDGSLLGGAAGATVVTANSRVPTNNPACSYNAAWTAYQCSQTWRTIVLQGTASAVGAVRIAPVQTTTLVSPTLNVTTFEVGPIDDDCALETYSNFIPFLALANAETDFVSSGTMIPNSIISVHSPVASERFLLTIFYTQPIQVSAAVNGAAATQLTTRHPALTDPVGTFAYDPQTRLLYVVLGGGSQATEFALTTSELIAVSMSLAVDFSTFDGALLIQYMAELLAIDPATIKVVSVHSGSTVAQYTIAGSPAVSGNATANAQYLNAVAANLVTVVSSGAFTAKTGYTVTSMTVTPPSLNGTAPMAATVSSPSGPALTAAEAAGVASGVIIGVVIAVLVVVFFLCCAGGYVVRQRRLAAASKSVYSAKEGIELPEARISEKMKAKYQPPPIVARKESIASTASSSMTASDPQASPPFFSTNAESRRESFATLNLDAEVEDDGRVYDCVEAYHPRFPQEMELRLGDELRKVVSASDSWYVATNERTGERGAVLKGHIQLRKLRPTPPREPPAATPEPAPYSLSSAPPLPAAATAEHSPDIARHTYVPAEDLIAEQPAVFYPPAARAPVINLDRWERSRSQRASLRADNLGVPGEPVTPKTPTTPQPPSPQPDEEEESKTQPTVGVHRRVLSMEKRWKQ